MEPSVRTTPITDQAETVTSGKFYQTLKLMLLLHRVSNGGFYPAKPVAEFQNTYVDSLRSYQRNRTPADYVRPKTTKNARRISRVGPSKVQTPDDYMRSQTYFMKN